jgi:mannose-1-phosphate guanylyltransferase
MTEDIRDKIFALIMAGGKGTRLFPLTTANQPKAFLSFDSTGVSLLKRTIYRLLGVIEPDNIFIVAGQAHEEELIPQTGNISKRNIILEPMSRNTLPCIGLAGLYIKRRDDSGVIAILPGEQLVEDEAEFQRIITRAAKAGLEHRSVVTLGIKPTFPATRFGYVRTGEEVSREDDIPVFKSLGFTEKPNMEKAEEFCSGGEYFWNSGIFILPVTLLFRMISAFAHDVYEHLAIIDNAIGTSGEFETISRVYKNIRSISIDYAIMEKAENVLIIPADIGWNDMGTWTEVAETWEKDSDSNACFGRHVGIDSSDCVIYSPNKLVTTVGVRDLIIVSTPAAVLVCHKDRADDVKKLAHKVVYEKS